LKITNVQEGDSGRRSSNHVKYRDCLVLEYHRREPGAKAAISCCSSIGAEEINIQCRGVQKLTLVIVEGEDTVVEGKGLKGGGEEREV